MVKILKRFGGGHVWMPIWNHLCCSDITDFYFNPNILQLYTILFIVSKVKNNFTFVYFMFHASFLCSFPFLANVLHSVSYKQPNMLERCAHAIEAVCVGISNVNGQSKIISLAPTMLSCYYHHAHT